MKKSFIAWGIGALVAALFAAFAGALRPLLWTALVSDQNISGFGVGWIGAIPAIYALLCLELADGLALAFQGIVLSHLAGNIGRHWRTKLSRAILHKMSHDSGSLLSRYVALIKTHVDVVELFYRQNLVQSIAAVMQLVFAIALVFVVNSIAASLLLCELACLIGLTGIYSRLHVRLAQRRLTADERLLANTSLNPRKGIAIWFGGIASLWFRERLREIKNLANARIHLSIGEVTYYNATTLTIGLFSVIGFAVIVGLGYSAKRDFLAFLLYSGLMMGPIVRVSAFIPECREYLLVKRGLQDAVRGSLQVEDKLDANTPLLFSGIDTRSDLRYPKKIEIGPNDRIALVGASGSGKTSAIEALLGAKEGILITPTVSGRASRNVSVRLPHIGLRYLTENPIFEMGSVLFNCQSSLAESTNIISSLGLFSEMDEIALKSFLGRIILPSGEPLSLGERQRIQLIRAMATNPRVLILDEALSGIDEKLEHNIISTLIEDKTIATLVYIGHRRSIQSLFDKRIELPLR
jgi:ABC-type transport system involved in cytochrome bd biosynthesis fused ATPase/permease subunit